jgi:hypothetical protein
MLSTVAPLRHLPSDRTEEPLDQLCREGGGARRQRAEAGGHRDRSAQWTLENRDPQTVSEQLAHGQRGQSAVARQLGSKEDAGGPDA